MLLQNTTGVDDSYQRYQCCDSHFVFRYLFWTDVGLKPRVMRARLDGQKKQVMADEKEQITGLTVDRTNDLIFWSTKERINVADLSGKNV